MLVQTLRTTVDILLLRRGPQHLPASWNLLGLLAALYLIVHLGQALTIVPFGSALLQALVATGLLALYVRVALQVRDRMARFAQTLSALLAVGVLATIVLLGPTAAMGPVLQQMAAGDASQMTQPPPLLPLLMAVVVSIWLLVVNGHIFRHALDVPLGFGVLVALGYEILLPLFFGLLAAAA